MDNEARGEQQLEDLIRQLPSVPKVSHSEVVLRDDFTLYNLLDQAEHGRKLMNYIVSTTSSESETVFKLEKLRHREHQLARTWFDEEKRGTVKISSAMLQIETPIVFSWSNQDDSETSSPVIEKPESPSQFRNISKTKELTTNQKLLNSASLAAKEKKVPTFENSIIEDNYFHDNTIDNLATQSSNSERNTSKEWKRSSFKVDPLQEFVATELPKLKKKSDEEVKGKKAKKKGLLWFWGSSKHKDKGKHSSKHTRTKNANLETHDNIESIDNENEAHNNVSEEDVCDFDMSQDFGEEDESNEVIGLGIQGDIKSIKSAGTSVKNNINDIDLLGYGNSNEADEVSMPSQTKSSTLEKPPGMEVLHIKDNPGMKSELNNIAGDVGKVQDHVIKASDDDGDDDDDDDDFGDFQQVVDESASIATSGNLASTQFPFISSSNHTVTPALTSFVPLQPKKK